MAHDPWQRIETHLWASALALGCQWERIGQTVGLLTHPRLPGDWCNHLRPLAVRAARAQWVEDVSEAVARLVRQGDEPIALFDPQQAPRAALVALAAAGLAPAETLRLMVLTTPPPPPATATDITLRPLGYGDDLADYARLWDAGFGGAGRPDFLAELQATLRATLTAGQTRYFIATLGGKPVGTGALILRGHVGEIIGIATLPEARQRGVARTMLCHLIARAQMARADLIFLAVAAGNPAEHLYAALGFREVGQHHLWRRPATTDA